jgi:tRNA modification GTPase
LFATDDTIVAIATPPGRGALGIVRLSGPDATRITAALINRRVPLEARRATLARIWTHADDPAAGHPIDEVIVTSFPEPQSFTGQDVVEITAHGSPVLLEAIVRGATRAGARVARPGEFTLRAFLSGRLDLVQAEAVADLIAAVTPAQALQAFDQLEGTLTVRIGEIDRALLDVVARLEASMDFPDEGYHFIGTDEAAAAVQALVGQVGTLLSAAGRGRILREGTQAVILGRTNVGKSCLFNYLVGSGRAIVSPHAGTTRDLLTEQVNIGGVPVTLVDTAGLRPAPDEVEREGVSRARQAAGVAGLAIVVLDRSVPLDQEDRVLLAETAGLPRVVVVNKCDLPAAWLATELTVEEPIEVSLLTTAGTEAIGPAMGRALGASGAATETPGISNVRHVELLERAKGALEQATRRAIEGAPEEIVLDELRQARTALEEVTGRRTAGDVLAHIFERFCVGK